MCAQLFQSCSTLQPHGSWPARLLCPWDSPGKNIGVGCHFLLQGIFPIQGLNTSLLHWQEDSLPLNLQGNLLSWIPTRMGCLQSWPFIWPLTGCSHESEPVVVLDERGWSVSHLGNHLSLVPSFPHLSFSAPNKGAACLPLPQGLHSEEPRSKLYF